MHHGKRIFKIFDICQKSVSRCADVIDRQPRQFRQDSGSRLLIRDIRTLHMRRAHNEYIHFFVESGIVIVETVSVGFMPCYAFDHCSREAIAQPAVIGHTCFICYVYAGIVIDKAYRTGDRKG